MMARVRSFSDGKKVHKVLIVDDSAVFRALLSEIIDSDPQLEVVGVAVDPYEAREDQKTQTGCDHS